MFETVITVVGSGCNHKKIENCINEIKKHYLCDVESKVLKENYAFDLFLSERFEVISNKFVKTLPCFEGLDVFIQKNDKNRKKKLLISDMDATMVAEETLDELAGEFGLKDKVSFITEKAMKGEMDFQQALEERVGLFKGKSYSSLQKVADKINYNKGAKELISTMNKFGATTILVSGGFDLFARKVAQELEFKKFFSNNFEKVENILTGKIIPPIIDKNMKAKILAAEAKENGLFQDETMAVGDGANDIAMLLKASAGVGYYAKPAVIEQVENQIRFTDLSSLLYMQGYRYEEFES